VIMVIGREPNRRANPVFGSQMKRRLREGRESSLSSTPRMTDSGSFRRTSTRDFHLQLTPSTNVAVLIIIRWRMSVVDRGPWRRNEFRERALRAGVVREVEGNSCRSQRTSPEER